MFAEHHGTGCGRKTGCTRVARGIETLKVVHAEVAQTIMVELEDLLGSGQVEIGVVEDRGRSSMRGELEKLSEVGRSVGSRRRRRFGRVASAREVGAAITRRNKLGKRLVGVCDVHDGKVATGIDRNRDGSP
jgi:hypothetical protein